MELQVGVKVFLQNTDGKFLLLERNREKYPTIRGDFDIVGGRIDVGTPLLENLTREVYEETKMILTSPPKLVYAQDIFVGDKKHVVRLTYRATTEGDPELDTDENISYAWVTLEEMQQHNDLDIFVQEILDTKIL